MAFDFVEAVVKLGPAVVVAVVAVITMGKVLNEYDKRRREDAAAAAKLANEQYQVQQLQHITERSEWRNMMTTLAQSWVVSNEKSAEKSAQTAEKIVDKLQQVLVDVNRALPPK